MKRYPPIQPSLFNKKTALAVLFAALIILAPKTNGAGLDLTLNSSPPCLTLDANGNCQYNQTTLQGYIQVFYQFALAIGGILAVGMIVAGSIYISISGSVDKEREGRSFITSALLGLVILLGAFLILKTLNPNLTTLTPPTAPPPVDQSSASQTCEDCSAISVTTSITEVQCKTAGNCQLNTTLWNLLKVAARNFQNTFPEKTIAITEAYPPALDHQSACHENGTCADIAIRLRDDSPDCQILNTLIQDIKDQGLSPFNEYFKAPAPCTGTKTQDTTGSNIHVSIKQ